MTLSPAGTISLTTIRLQCTGSQGTSVGTGFLYDFPAGQVSRPNDLVQVIVTNKHVVSGTDQLQMTLTWMPHGVELNDATLTKEGIHERVDIRNLQQRLIPHPDPDIDVCLILIGDAFAQVSQGRKLRNISISRSAHLTTDEEQMTRPIESLLMIGYPNGLWDERNNRPIIRRGLSATHILGLWNGQRQFLIDAACFPGSSGSPVFLYEDGYVRLGQDNYGPGAKARFVGLLFAGPTINQEGALVERAIPTGVALVPVFQNMMNLGYVVHASTLDDFIPIIQARISQEMQVRGHGLA